MYAQYKHYHPCRSRILLWLCRRFQLCSRIPNRKLEVTHTSEPASSVLTANVAGGKSIQSNAVLGFSPDRPAPPLSSIFINNVCSPTACESDSSGQLSTSNTYTGSNVYVYVWEIGYGSGEIATQGGTTVSNAYLVAKQAVCQSGSSYVTPCPNGSTVAGWRYEWNVGYHLSNNYAKNFTAQGTSLNSPFNTISTSMQIQYTK